MKQDSKEVNWTIMEALALYIERMVENRNEYMIRIALDHVYQELGYDVPMLADAKKGSQ